MTLQMDGALASTAGSSPWSGFNSPLQSADDLLVTPTPGLNRRALRRALAFIDHNLGERFSLETLAASAGISRFHFARSFRAATGYSPMEYLMRLRIERSKLILAHGGYSICEVAVLLGFCDQSHFTRTFRRAVGMSPRDYTRRTEQLRDLAR